MKIETLRIPPPHPMREIRGAYDEIMARELADPRRGEYLRVVLTDRRPGSVEHDALKAMLAARDSKLLDIESEFERPAGAAKTPSSAAVREKSVEELFVDYYKYRADGENPDDETVDLLRAAGERLRHADPSAEPASEDVDRLLEVLLGKEGQA